VPEFESALKARGVPAARFVLIAGSVFQIIAGLLLMLGVCPRAAALGLVLFTVVASIMFLNFWDAEGPAREAGRIGFQTNVGIIGGLLIAAAQY